jgi:uncharacterized protein DUF4386
MTLQANARVAGVAYLLYIAAGISAMVLFGKATAGTGIPAKLAGLAQHADAVRLSVLLSFTGCFAALVLAVTLWALTREQDPHVAMFGLVCRAAEGVSGAVSIPATLGLLWLARASGADAPDPAATQAIAAFLLKDTPFVSATFFAVGSTAFCWLLLRGRMIPVALAWLGVIASLLLVVLLPVEVLVPVGALVAWLKWMPMLVFEVTVALWFIIKGVAGPFPRTHLAT